MLLHEGFTAQVARRPDATALVWRDWQQSYAGLEQEANRLAHLLGDAGIKPGDRVALLVPKGPAAILGLLGALKAGAAYVPLDPSDAPKRLARTLAAADCRIVLGASPLGVRSLREALSSTDAKQRPLIGWLDDAAPLGSHALFTRRDLGAFPTSAPAPRTGQRDLAQIVFTSDATGFPKGVMITHASTSRFLEWAGRYFGIRHDDRLSQHAPLRFVVSSFDIFGALWAGAELHLVPPELNLVPNKLAQFIRDAALTQWFSVPAVLNLLAKFDVLRDRDFPSLRRIIFAGEVLPTPSLIYWMKRVPQAKFTNLYGPTETTIASSYHTVKQCPTDDREPISIGRPCDGEEFLLLDEHMRPVPVGTVGDLYIRGVGLAAGYWRDRAKTEAAFVPDPDDETGLRRLYRTGDRVRRGQDGQYYFCGRADRQIKSRGYRIELGEIEDAMASVPQVRECAVIGMESGRYGGTLVCCAYALELGKVLTLNALRARLKELLPSYMLPVRWLRYDALPRTAQGKVDLTKLERAFSGGEIDVGARSRVAQAPGVSGAPTRSLNERQ